MRNTAFIGIILVIVGIAFARSAAPEPPPPPPQHFVVIVSTPGNTQSGGAFLGGSSASSSTAINGDMNAVMRIEVVANVCSIQNKYPDGSSYLRCYLGGNGWTGNGEYWAWHDGTVVFQGIAKAFYIDNTSAP